MLFLVYESSQNPDFRNQTPTLKPMLASYMISSTLFNLSDSQYLYWQNGDVTKTELILKVKGDHVYKALRQICSACSSGKLTWDVVIKLTGAVADKHYSEQ